jgi:hypothetical protein
MEAADMLANLLLISIRTFYTKYVIFYSMRKLRDLSTSPLARLMKRLTMAIVLKYIGIWFVFNAGNIVVAKYISTEN